VLRGPLTLGGVGAERRTTSAATAEMRFILQNRIL
jgi:hypothetical protein